MKQLRAADLLPGDQIDFEPILAAFPPATDDFDAMVAHESNVMIAESEMFKVQEVERESVNSYVLHTDHISFAVPSDFLLNVERHQR